MSKGDEERQQREADQARREVQERDEFTGVQFEDAGADVGKDVLFRQTNGTQVPAKVIADHGDGVYDLDVAGRGPVYNVREGDQAEQYSGSKGGSQPRSRAAQDKAEARDVTDERASVEDKTARSARGSNAQPGSGPSAHEKFPRG